MKQLVRKNIAELKPYSCARFENGLDGLLLDANENPNGWYNRYPDPNQSVLKQRLAAWKGVEMDQIFIGNGSDEIIDLLMRVFCEPGKDKILQFTPTYGMYKVCADINNVDILSLKLDSDFQIDKEAIQSLLEKENPKLIFVCSPNNPTGNCMDRGLVPWLLKNYKGIVVVDEAYIDFANKKSAISLLDKSDRLIVLQTFSKALGAAGARIGVGYSNPELLDYLNRIKPPYNISTPNQDWALSVLDNLEIIEAQNVVIVAERERLRKELNALECVKKIYPSDANFLLVEMENPEAIYQDLKAKGIVIRNMTSKVKDALRITIGLKEENDLVISALKEVYYEEGIVCR